MLAVSKGFSVFERGTGSPLQCRDLPCREEGGVLKQVENKLFLARSDH